MRCFMPLWNAKVPFLGSWYCQGAKGKYSSSAICTPGCWVFSSWRAVWLSRACHTILGSSRHGRLDRVAGSGRTSISRSCSMHGCHVPGSKQRELVAVVEAQEGRAKARGEERGEKGRKLLARHFFAFDTNSYYCTILYEYGTVGVRDYEWRRHACFPPGQLCCPSDVVRTAPPNFISYLCLAHESACGEPRAAPTPYLRYS